MSKKVKQTVLQSFFVLELFTIGFFYLFGTQGLPVVYRFRQENQQLQEEIVQMRVEVAALEKELNDWHHYPYYKEKIARQQLQMARADEQIYYMQ